MEEVRDARRRVATTMVDGSRLALIVLREALLVSVCAVGAALFLNHQILYLEDLSLNPVPWPAWAISTAVLFSFIRGISLVATIRVPRVSGDSWQCPECGQWIEDGTPRAGRSREVRPVRARVSRPILVSTAPQAVRRTTVGIEDAVSGIPGEVVNAPVEVLPSRVHPATPDPAFDPRSTAVRSHEQPGLRTGRS